MRSSTHIQQEFKKNKISNGFKRIQIWKIDEKNEAVRRRIESACKKINQLTNETDLINEIAQYTHSLLRDSPI